MPKARAPKYNVAPPPHFCHTPWPLSFEALKGFLPSKLHSIIPDHLPCFTLPYHIAIATPPLMLIAILDIVQCQQIAFTSLESSTRVVKSSMCLIYVVQIFHHCSLPWWGRLLVYWKLGKLQLLSCLGVASIQKLVLKVVLCLAYTIKNSAKQQAMGCALQPKLMIKESSHNSEHKFGD